MELRKELERDFHNKTRLVADDTHVADTRWTEELETTISTNPLWANMKYYAVERKSRIRVLEWFKNNCQGKKVLDLCCGNGDDSIFLAKNGAKKVIGLDISDVSVENCRISAKRNNVTEVATFVLGDAENTEFPDNSFDVIAERRPASRRPHQGPARDGQDPQARGKVHLHRGVGA